MNYMNNFKYLNFNAVQTLYNQVKMHVKVASDGSIQTMKLYYL